eukprot:11184870-Lingulodinium_polyedra.AAC.1
MAGSDREGATAPEEDVAMFCDICGMWLNGWEQFQEHTRSRKHRKKTLQATSGHAWSSVDAAAATAGT